jgi:DNA-binding transcriptional MerR regulator
VGRKTGAGHTAITAEKLAAGTPRMGIPTAIAGLTVSDIAARLAPIAPNLHNTVQRLRHWGREGVLRPIESSAHAGPGVHRLYPDAVLYSAAFLCVLTTAGLPVSHSRFLKTIMPRVDAAAAQWHAARQKGQTAKFARLLIGMTATGESRTGELKDLRDAALTLEFDLAKIFAQVSDGRS